MILQREELVARVGSWIDENGRRSTMSFVRTGEDQTRFDPLAVPEGAPWLTAGSILQSGTPAGVAMNAPSPLSVNLRGALHLRSPFEQFLIEEKERVAAGETGYLAEGDVVLASIDGLGSQRFEIGKAVPGLLLIPVMIIPTPKGLREVDDIRESNAHWVRRACLRAGLHVRRRVGGRRTWLSRRAR